MKLKYLTRKAKKQYLEKPNQCPYCGGLDPLYGALEVEGAVVTQSASCPECFRTWIDCYYLSAIVETGACCSTCGKHVEKEDEVAFRPDKGYAHAACVQEHWTTKESA